MIEDVVERFTQVFRGRGDAYGSWNGGCIKQPLTRRQFEQHLGNGPHIGVYPLITDKVSWGCIDIDGKDFDRDWDTMFTLARNLTTMLRVKKVYAHTERTSNGYHLWIFPDAPLVPASHMRRALMAACKAIGYDPKEVNPKQEKAVGVGNYVRLPYYGAITNGTPPDRHFVDTEGTPIDLVEALGIIENSRTHPDDLAHLATLWQPPPRSQTVNTTYTEVDTSWLTGREFVCWRDGPAEGYDRSGTLVRLARLMLERGVEPDQVFPILKSADQRWGKFYERPDCDEQLVAIIERMASKIHA
ncbi:MAG: TOTE conflict system archaeo-eukaryotic primase domain-containing protein [Ilumatobacteraceae bacterium]